MKKYLLWDLLIILLIFNISCYSQIDCDVSTETIEYTINNMPTCYNEGESGCTQWEASSQIVQLAHNNCPSGCCQVRVCYIKRLCNNLPCPNLKEQIYIYQISFLTGDTDCDIFLSLIYPFWPATDYYKVIDPEGVKILYREAYDKLSTALFEEKLAANPEMYNCSGTPCQAPNECSPGTFQYFLSTCASACPNPLSHGSPGHPPVFPNEHSLYFKPCNSSANCCTYIKQYCYCPPQPGETEGKIYTFVSFFGGNGTTESCNPDLYKIDCQDAYYPNGTGCINMCD